LQEYYCDFNAPLVGAYYAKQIQKLEDMGRITTVDYQPPKKVNTYWDLGWTDDTTIWFVQTVGQEIHVVDAYSAHGQDINHYAKVLQDRGYVYGDHWLPHDAKAKTLASGGKSIVEQLFSAGIKCKIVPDLSLQDGIQATRAILPRCWFDAKRCKAGLEALRQYQREWNDDAKVFRPTPLHNWASHYADAFRYFAVAYKTDNPSAFNDPNYRAPTLNELWSRSGVQREARI
jgi:phage terminase large subunit